MSTAQTMGQLPRFELQPGHLRTSWVTHASEPQLPHLHREARQQLPHRPAAQNEPHRKEVPLACVCSVKLGPPTVIFTGREMLTVMIEPDSASHSCPHVHTPLLEWQPSANSNVLCPLQECGTHIKQEERGGQSNMWPGHCRRSPWGQERLPQRRARVP